MSHVGLMWSGARIPGYRVVRWHRLLLQHCTSGEGRLLLQHYQLNDHYIPVTSWETCLVCVAGYLVVGESLFGLIGGIFCASVLWWGVFRGLRHIEIQLLVSTYCAGVWVLLNAMMAFGSEYRVVSCSCVLLSFCLDRTLFLRVWSDVVCDLPRCRWVVALISCPVGI